MVDIELIGGPMDGAILHRTNPPDRLKLKNPNPLTYQSNLCAPLVLKQVTYIYSHSIVGDRPKMFYVFEGHIE